jgi:hypothetical protein
MPVIPTERHGRRVRVNPLVLYAVMCFPNDETARSHLLVRTHERVASQAEEMLRKAGRFPAMPLGRAIGENLGRSLQQFGGFSALSKAPTFEEISERMAAQGWPGAISGDILLDLLQMTVAGTSASVNKAVALAVRSLSGAAAAGEGVASGGRSERYVREAWGNFKPVSHLWAAFRMIQLGVTTQGGELNYTDRLLVLSHFILKLALTLRPKGRGSLLSSEEVWRLSRRYKLPFLLSEFKLPPLEAWKVEVLRQNFKSFLP